MRYPFSLAAIPASLYKNAQSPEIGVDTNAKFSPHVPILLGSVLFTAAAVAVLTTTGNAIPVGWNCVSRVIGSPLYGTTIETPLVPIIVTLNATLTGAVADKITATYSSPGWSLKQLNLYPEFTSRDFIPATIGNVDLAVTTLGSLDTVSGGQAGDQIEIWAFPPAETFQVIDCVRDKNGGPPRSEIIAIACGRNPAAHTKLGRAEQSELELTVPYKGFLEQMSRFSGVKGTVTVEVKKDGQAYTQVEAYAGYIPSMAHTRGDGNDVVTATFSAPFEQFFAGYAL